MSFTVFLRKANGYTYNGDWQFFGPPVIREPFESEAEALVKYDEQLKELPLQAAFQETAVQLSIVQDANTSSEKVIRSKIYDGESVRFYYAAYERPGKRFIDQILADINYYAAMFPAAGITTVAIASTMEELQYLLGEEYDTYESLT